MTLISKHTQCFNCDKGHMHRDTTKGDEWYKYTCDTCGSYTLGLMSGHFGTQHYNRDGSQVFDDNGMRIKK